MGFALRFAIGDDVQDDVAVGAPDLVLSDDPVELQRDAEFVRQRLPQLDLEPRRIGRLAGKGQRVGMRAQPKRTDRANGVERTPLRRADKADRDADHERDNCFHSMVHIPPDRSSPLHPWRGFNARMYLMMSSICASLKAEPNAGIAPSLPI